ncbi:hypothetical protein HBI56_064550 [Parastagonospora nodorum]|uniref:Uncharacterized protein n=2 Tax=Phaeosphaeria nodorum (strain SN15 / ATCC MYA-4574 / FGSC 10173) TaxID=321614 RepID=A0A7U2I377_PHANO|nr:hypothetical protein SNOG_08500 [Parastagonospora nodorum SN15]KAH3906904.1 hypothetical protein HBH56_199050 [Parastagonospora nodorum]EAT83668.1 hypothetical protein SNOG_08500 [Parastagonospora nodorum SN15]KAH3924590.1 hypothetical protein HBH54_192010 [Parastagonospora nodorum]KAH3938616.1 hypothetical protein HBH53_248180 [Parastagonospora nodorum]KAH3957831.1 hypothetical protein HBH51_219810 [Parastagonospora nodorum]
MAEPIPNIQTVKDFAPNNPAFLRCVDRCVQEKRPSTAIDLLLDDLKMQSMEIGLKKMLHKAFYHAVFPYVKQERALKPNRGWKHIIAEIEEGTGIGFTPGFMKKCVEEDTSVQLIHEKLDVLLDHWTKHNPNHAPATQSAGPTILQNQADVQNAAATRGTPNTMPSQYPACGDSLPAEVSVNEPLVTDAMYRSAQQTFAPDACDQNNTNTTPGTVQKAEQGYVDNEATTPALFRWWADDAQS